MKIDVSICKEWLGSGTLWVATDDDTYDGQEGDPIGYGSTREEAIESLEWQIAEREEERLEMKNLLNK